MLYVFEHIIPTYNDERAIYSYIILTKENPFERLCNDGLIYNFFLTISTKLYALLRYREILHLKK